MVPQMLLQLSTVIFSRTGKNVSYSQFVFVASIIQRAVSMRHIVIVYGMFSFAVFFHIINGTIFGKTLLDNVS
jgi:hypothetical protein